MALIVQKYGGTSVGTTDRIKNVAVRVARWRAQGHQVVVVVSAMSGETNRLIGLAKEIQPNPDPRELDAVASTGEQVTIGSRWPWHLKRTRRRRQVSYTGGTGHGTSPTARSPRPASSKASTIRTPSPPISRMASSRCRRGIPGHRRTREASRRSDAVVPTRLGVAIAAALKADECQIYTDVDGVYTTDPRIEPDARRLAHRHLRGDARDGQPRVQGAADPLRRVRRQVQACKLRVLSSLTDPEIPIDEEAQSGTLITFEEDENMEQPSHLRHRVQRATRPRSP
jgi:aspartate kinase